METETQLVRSPDDRELPRSIVERMARISHRPRTSYRLHIRSAQDAEEARAFDIPVFAVTESMITMLGYPMHFRPIILAPRTLHDALTTDLPVIEFTKEDVLKQPRAEDLVVAMLRFDPLAARAIAERNWDMLEADYLMKRILQEDAEEEATRVRFQELLPSLPKRGEPLPKKALERAISKNVSRGRLP